MADSASETTPGRSFVAGFALGLEAAKWEPGRTLLRTKPAVLPNDDDTYVFLGFDSDFMALLEVVGTGYRCAAAPEQMEVVRDV